MDEFWVFLGILANFFRVYWYTTTPHPWPTLISRETLFLTDIYIVNLFVLMSFDNYIYLIPFNFEYLWSGCSVWIILCNVLDRYICYFPSWNILLCCYFMVSKSLFNVLLVLQGYNKWIWLQTWFFFFDEVLSSRSSVVRQWLSSQPLLFIFEFLLCFFKFCVNV